MTRAKRFSSAFIALASVPVLLLQSQAPAHSQEKRPAVKTPRSIHVEHEAIHSALVEATKAPGRLGDAAKALARVLHPHFVREEEIATPPLGLLAPLAADAKLSDAQITAALEMTDALRRELPKMLKEHERIREAVAELRRVATEEQAPKYQQLADDLALHAQIEEDVLYPAAILVGDILRARQTNR